MVTEGTGAAATEAVAAPSGLAGGATAPAAGGPLATTTHVNREVVERALPGRMAPALPPPVGRG